MEILKEKSVATLILSMQGEIAKANNEISCARRDLERAQTRLNLCGAIINELLTRKETK